MKPLITTLFLFMGASAICQQKTSIILHPEQAQQVIDKNIYGQFAEHLGSCIYGGLWVGEESAIPNQNGYRKDVLDALTDLKIPVLRWPGGCFADEYHWMDGIGPVSHRPKMVNNNWGGTIEDNSFGTHEFLNLCELLGCEPYISGNVGSGSVEELAKWVEYMTSDGDSPMANLRRENGRDKAWNVKYLGVGNESWGCGGNMRPEYYSDLYRRYATYCRNYDDNRLYRIASGASDYDYNWTEVLMKNIGNRMDAVSLHYYTVTGWRGSKGSATDFNKDDYYWTMGKCLEVEDVLKKHIAIMDRYDRDKKIALLLDEWGTWWDEEPGTVRGHLYQQNTLRDAMVAALSFNVFHKYTDRLKMANIAQIVNVLQSMILTNDEGMVLTPSYYVFKMYQPHQDAVHLPLTIDTEKKIVREERIVPMISATASRDKNGKTHISLVNIDAERPHELTVSLNGISAKTASGEVLTADDIQAHNTFGKPASVIAKPFTGVKVKGSELLVSLPARSIVTLELN